MQHDADALTALLPYTSSGQARYIETIIATGSMRAASKELGINRRTIKIGRAHV